MLRKKDYFMFDDKIRVDLTNFESRCGWIMSLRKSETHAQTRPSRHACQYKVLGSNTLREKES